MRVLFTNVDFTSSSGPNGFAKKLAIALSSRGHVIADEDHFDVQLAFIMAPKKLGFLVQRIDGIYFNVAQDWQVLNDPIRRTYNVADRVIVQSEFDQGLIKTFFGQRDDIRVIHNGTDLSVIREIEPMVSTMLDRFERVWCCASSWRPHKRLRENVKFFFERANHNDCLVIAGGDPDVKIADPRVFYAGQLTWEQLISLYKRSSMFVHLAFFDHCPNVVIDARACGCQIACSSTGGTEEIAGQDAIVIEEDEWNMLPIELWKPPVMDFSRQRQGRFDNAIDIAGVAIQYESVMSETVSSIRSGEQ